jgi:purine-binding chemotaxis protein CheW
MKANQFSTFRVDGRYYGVQVRLVQEITQPMPITRVPLSPRHVAGLINLRGQIATAISMRKLFKLSTHEEDNPGVNVICKCEGPLLALMVDEIGDVLEVDESDFEQTPSTINPDVGQFMSGVYKLPNEILSIIDIQKLIQYLNQ